MATHSSILAWRIPWTEEPGKGNCKVIQKGNDRLRDRKEKITSFMDTSYGILLIKTAKSVSHKRALIYSCEMVFFIPR